MKLLRFSATRLGVLCTLLVVALFAPAALSAMPFLLSPGVTTTAFNAGGASDINEALKIFFNDPVIYNVVSDSELLSYFEEDNNAKQDETTGGRYIETAQYFQLPARAGARPTTIDLPAQQGVKERIAALRKLVTGG